MRILDVHNLITNVIGRFYQIYEGMAHISQAAFYAGLTRNAQFFSYPLVDGDFALKETEFGMSASQIGRKGIFDDGSQGGVSHDKPSVAPAFEVVGQQPECVGVSFEMNQVVPFPFAEPVPVRGVAVGPQPVAFAFAEERPDGSLARMSEGRIS